MSKTDILLSSVNEFYSDDKNKSTLMGILDKSGGISLRNIEWFITNYAKKNHTSYTTSNGRLFTVQNYLTPLLDLKNLRIRFRGHLMKFKRLSLS
jgi:hypothetical protein